MILYVLQKGFEVRVRNTKSQNEAITSSRRSLFAEMLKVLNKE